MKTPPDAFIEALQELNEALLAPARSDPSARRLQACIDRVSQLLNSADSWRHTLTAEQAQRIATDVARSFKMLGRVDAVNRRALETLLGERAAEMVSESATFSALPATRGAFDPA